MTKRCLPRGTDTRHFIFSIAGEQEHSIAQSKNNASQNFIRGIAARAQIIMRQQKQC